MNIIRDLLRFIYNFVVFYLQTCFTLFAIAVAIKLTPSIISVIHVAYKDLANATFLTFFFYIKELESIGRLLDHGLDELLGALGIKQVPIPPHCAKSEIQAINLDEVMQEWDAAVEQSKKNLSILFFVALLGLGLLQCYMTTKKERAREVALRESSPTDIKVVQCVVCWDRKRSVRFDPCGHFCICKVCFIGMVKCPLCRKAIAQGQQTFLS